MPFRVAERVQKGKKCPIILVFIAIPQKSVSTSDQESLQFLSIYIGRCCHRLNVVLHNQACVLGINIQISGYPHSKKGLIIMTSSSL